MTIQCTCECGCQNEATTTDDNGNDVCEDCSEYKYDDEDGTFIGCGSSGLGTTCHVCKEPINWGGIETHQSGQPNSREGECACGCAWTDEQRGNWGHYKYKKADVPNDDKDENEDD